MPSAARVGDQVMHSQALPEAKHGFWGGLLKGALIGAAIVAVAAVAVVATVGTGGLGAPFAIGGAMVVIGSALRYGSVGFSEGAQKGSQQIVRAGPITTGSGNVFINGKAAALACLSLVACTQHGPKSKVAQGSQTVTINSKMASRVGDKGTCSFVIGEGSPNVFIGAPAGTCATISGEIPDWMWTGVKVAYWTGTVMEVAGGLIMGGPAGLKALLTPAGLSVLGGSMLAGHLASDWAKSQGYSLSDQMMFGDLTGAFVGAGLATGGPSAMRGLQQMADAIPRFDMGMEPAFAGGPRMGGFGEPEIVPRDPNGPGMDAWNPPKNEPLQMTGDESGTRGAGASEPRFKSDGTFEDPTTESNYQRYVDRNTSEGRPVRDRGDWKTASDNWKNSPAARGNDFNTTVNDRGDYPYNEVNLENGKRVDGYQPAEGDQPGAIISRKAIDFDGYSESDFRAHLSEFNAKYEQGTIIRSNKYPEIDGQALSGRKILEVPDSNLNAPNRQQFEDIARSYGIEIRYTPEH